MAHSFGEVVLVPFPFTDQSGTKKRPAVIVSSGGYNANRHDLIIMAITSQARMPPGFGEAAVADSRRWTPPMAPARRAGTRGRA